MHEATSDVTHGSNILPNLHKLIFLHLLLFQPALNTSKPHIKAQLTLVFYKVKNHDKQFGPPENRNRPKLKWTG